MTSTPSSARPSLSIARMLSDQAHTPLPSATRSAYGRLSQNDEAGSEEGEKLRMRIATVADAETLWAAEEATRLTPGLLVCWPGEITVDSFRTRIEKLATAGRYIVAEESGSVVGHALLDPMGSQANGHVFLLTIVVHPGHLECGIGTAMLRDLLDWAQCSARVGKVELNVRAGNLRAQHLYRSLGFVEEARFRKRVHRIDGEFEDDIGMAWFPDRAHAAGAGIKLSTDGSIQSGNQSA
ncbi:MAG: GNAT family N-acetyltransferase [Rhodanobacteraceae bacterium]